MEAKNLPSVAMLLALPALFAAGVLFSGGNSASKDPLEAVLVAEAAAVNATLPEMVSENVRLDKTAAGPGNAFTYFYTLTDDASAKEIAINSVRGDELRVQLTERVCTMMPEVKKRGTYVIYSFRDNAGAAVAEVRIKAKECDAPQTKKG
ncbi:MAG TPA: hypothetical protein VEH76_07370 [Methylocystis sp.]|nr:hypothetical protein [Methylocystis sp.]